MISVPEIPKEFNAGDFLLDRHIRENRGKRIAIYYEGEKITYEEVLVATNRIGNVLNDLGIEQENRVAICLPDCPQLIYCYLGAMRIGAVPVPISTLAHLQDYLYYLNDSRAKALITSEELAPAFMALRSELRYLGHLIVLGKSLPGQLNYDELVKNASPYLEVARTSKDDMAFWQYSSGTTGAPKGVVHLHHDLLYYMPPYCNEVISITEEDIVFSKSKMYFSYGRNNSIEIPFLSGAGVVLSPHLPKPENLVKVVTTYRPTIFFSVPSSYATICDLIETSTIKYDFSSVRVFASAGEALPKVIFERWKELFGLEILEGIGSTDVGAIYISNLPGKTKPGSAGVLLGGFEAKLVNEDGEVIKKEKEIGTLWIKNDGISPYYWNKHEKTKECIRGEWFNTGDKFYQTEDGFYWFSGRADDLVKVGGMWVSPLEVEGILMQHSAVRECAVIGAPDAASLEKLLAFVVLGEGYGPSPQLEQELQEFVRSKTAHYKCPRWIRFINELPRTATGKTQRFKLRQLLKTSGIPKRFFPSLARRLVNSSKGAATISSTVR
jgi:benzoate-CoA ligase family protein